MNINISWTLYRCDFMYCFIVKLKLKKSTNRPYTNHSSPFGLVKISQLLNILWICQKVLKSSIFKYNIAFSGTQYKVQFRYGWRFLQISIFYTFSYYVEQCNIKVESVVSGHDESIVSVFPATGSFQISSGVAVAQSVEFRQQHCHHTAHQHCTNNR